MELLNLTRNEENNLTGYANFNVVVRDQYGSLVTEGNVVIRDSEDNVIVNKTLVDGLTVINLPVNYDPDGSPFGNSSVNPGINVNISIIYEETENYLSSQAFITNLTEFYKALVVSRSTIYENGEPVSPWYFSDGVWVYCSDAQVGIYYLPDPDHPDPDDPKHFIAYSDTVRYNPDYTSSGKPTPYIRVTVTNETTLYDPILSKFVEYDSNAVQYIKNALLYYEEYLNILDDSPDKYYVQNLVHVLNGYYKYMESAELYANGRDTNPDIIDVPGFGYEYDDKTYSYFLDELEPGLFLSYFVNETIEQVNSGNKTPNHGVKEVLQDGRVEYQFYAYNPYNYYFGIHLWQRTIGIDYYYVPDPTEFVTNITNTHIPENVTINVTKVWNDTDNQDGIRPDNITVALYKGDELNDTFTLSEDNDWKHTFKDLPKYENGELIDYGVDEVIGIVPTTKGSDDVDFIHYVPEGYTLKIDEVSEYNFTFTNTHVPEKTNIAIIKNWTDDNDKVNLRPNHIVVRLYANGEELGNPVILSEDNDWKGIFTDLDVYCDGEKIEYTVVEDVPRNYTASYNYTMNITISRDNEFVLRGTRLSDDEGKVTYYLVADGDKIIDSVSISIKDYYDTIHWEFTFTDLPVYSENNELISYTINETFVEEPSFVAEVYVDYNMTCSYAVNIDNRITGITTINVTKVWNDTDNNDGKRPDTVNITLVIDGVPSDQTLELTGDDWAGSFDELPMYHENGTAIVYNVTEVESDVPEGYTLSNVVFCEGRFRLINTHVPENISVNVTKVWDDV
ncbi:Cna B-type domain-containing protein, partial [Methanosphaera sp.]|uniref:Cna B-type domain-containing protein n=1 Tax=Methanosphaera sp. TaxID=2666342 RepID=UPI002E75D747